jgi:hypothetical protein
MAADERKVNSKLTAAGLRGKGDNIGLLSDKWDDALFNYNQALKDLVSARDSLAKHGKLL